MAQLEEGVRRKGGEKMLLPRIGSSKCGWGWMEKS